MKVFISLLLFTLVAVRADCPNLTGAKTWSSLYSSVAAGGDIVVSDVVVLTASPIVILGSITITGTLFIQDVNLELRTGSIKVASGGYLIAGGSDCPIKNKVIFTFYGSSADKDSNKIGTDSDGTKFGTKGLVVANGGSIVLYGDVNGPSWTRIANTVTKGSTSITLKESVQWKKDDFIIITSTDFSDVLDSNKVDRTLYAQSIGFPFPDQNEKRRIVSVSQDGKTIGLDSELKFTHYGKDYQYSEVGLLTRNIVLRSEENSDSDSDNGFGGHVLMRKGKRLELQGIEVTRMGQRGVLARYPIHFHNMSAVYSDLKPFIKHSSLHDNFQRCLVIHESHGVTVSHNVAYNTSGHCYFLEDGMEHANIFDSNLGVLSKPIAGRNALLASDDRASVFWITNPNNTWTGNAAVGGHHGFWFAMPERPRNLAKSNWGASNPYAYPRRHPLGRFSDNVAHSNRENGVHIDDMENGKDDGSTSLADFTPMKGPYTEAWPYGQGQLEAHFTGILAYKNRDSGIWGKTSLRFSRCILQDNRRGFMVNGKTILHDSIITGETENVGNPVPIYGKSYERSYPSKWGNVMEMLEGHSSYDNGGPQFSIRNSFYNFVSTPTRKAAALVPLHNGPFMLFPGTQFGHGISFENSNEFYIDYGSQDCEYGWNVLDADGKITNTPGGAWIQSNETLFRREGCEFRQKWNAYVCPLFSEGYLQLTLRGNNPSSAASSTGYDVPKEGARTIRGVLRPLGEGYDGKKGGMQGASTGGSYQYMHNLITRKSYVVEFYSPEGKTSYTPNPLTVTVQSSQPGDWVILAIPFPSSSSSSFTITRSYFPNLVQVDSLSKLDEKSFFYSMETKHLYVLMNNEYEGKNPSDAFGYKVPDNGNYRSLVITASCGTTCQPHMTGIPPAIQVPEAFVSEDYVAFLTGSQSLSTPNSAHFGRAFFFFHPKASSGKRELHYKIFHDIAGEGNVIKIMEGSPGNPGRELSFRDIPIGNTASAGIWYLTRSEWEKLASGNLYVSVAGSDGKEVIRGRILCSGSCSKPPKNAISLGDVCKPSYEIQSIYSDSNFQAPIVYSSWNDSRIGNKNLAFSSDFLCGSSSLSLPFRDYTAVGASWWSAGPNGLNLDLNKFKSIEFFVKSAKGTEPVSLGIWMGKQAGEGGNIDITSSDIDNFVIDETVWSRVRVSLSKFKTDGIIRSLFLVNRYNYPRADIIVDEWRFITEEASPITELADIQIPKASDFYGNSPSPSGHVASPKPIMSSAISNHPIVVLSFVIVAMLFMI